MPPHSVVLLFYTKVFKSNYVQGADMSTANRKPAKSENKAYQPSHHRKLVCPGAVIKLWDESLI
nr:hypothetical protein [Candidatus Freyarchaeota archaeon]